MGTFFMSVLVYANSFMAETQLQLCWSAKSLNRRSFTLLELMVEGAIVELLAVLASPPGIGGHSRSEVASRINIVHALATEQDAKVANASWLPLAVLTQQVGHLPGM